MRAVIETLKSFIKVLYHLISRKVQEDLQK